MAVAGNQFRVKFSLYCWVTTRVTSGVFYFAYVMWPNHSSPCPSPVPRPFHISHPCGVSCWLVLIWFDLCPAECKARKWLNIYGKHYRNILLARREYTYTYICSKHPRRTPSNFPLAAFYVLLICPPIGGVGKTFSVSCSCTWGGGEDGGGKCACLKGAAKTATCRDVGEREGGEKLLRFGSGIAITNFRAKNQNQKICNQTQKQFVRNSHKLSGFQVVTTCGGCNKIFITLLIGMHAQLGGIPQIIELHIYKCRSPSFKLIKNASLIYDSKLQSQQDAEMI